MTPETVAALKVLCASRFKVSPAGDIDGCFLCRWALEDLEANGALTDGGKLRPGDPGKPLFPLVAKLWHLKLEMEATKTKIDGVELEVSA